jgi:photosystem II stability/assembly factor-like uncharacterized protein/PKD repeat protein
MKKNTFKNWLFVSLLLLAGSSIFSTLQAQEWLKELPKTKMQKQLTLKDYQKAFYTHLKEAKSEEMNREEENEVLDENYEKFKRWEWFWESRVDPTTGAFPQQDAYTVFKTYKAEHAKDFLKSAGNWTSIGPVSSLGGYAGLGRINCVAFSPVDTSVLYVGSASGGAWKTTDAGANWTPLGDFNNALGVADMVVVNEGGEDIVYLGTGDKDHWDTYSIGVMKSTDGGQTWNKTGLSWEQRQYGMIYRLLLDPNDHNTLYAASNGGLFKTTNAGQTWSLINSRHLRDIEFQPGSNTRMYGTSSQNGAIYLSENAGQTWTKVIDNTDNKRTELAVSADSANVVYAIMAASDDGLLGIYRSRDAGQSYTMVFDSLNLLGWNCNGKDDGGQGWYDLTIAVDPTNANKVFIGGVNTWMSEDGGKSWKMSNHWSSTCSNKNEVVHADKHYMAYQQGTNTLFECNDGGIYKTKEGSHWDYIGSGLVTSQIYRLSTSKTIGGEVIAGLQDNGTKLFSSGSWDDVMGGDGMECLIDYTDVNVQYGETPNGSISRTKDHWGHSTDITNGLTGNGAWVTPFIMDPVDPNTLYVGYQDVFKSTDQGDNWTKISSWNDKTIRSLTIAPSDNKVLFAATYSILYRSTDGGSHWDDITGSLPVDKASITYIAVKNDDPNTFWVSLSGFNEFGVYETSNGGTTWDNVSTGLPELPVNSLVQNILKTDTAEIYAGTDVGVFVRQNNSRWIPFIENLPNVPIGELEIQYDGAGGGDLYAATFGRGLWKSPLFTGKIEAIKAANFEADNTSPKVIDTVRFTDLSNNNPTSWSWSFSPATVAYLNSTSSSSQNPVVMFNKSGRYTVSLTATGDSSYTKVKVDYIDAQDVLSVMVTANRTEVCSGDTTQLFAKVTGGSGDYNYSWSTSPLGFSSTSANPVVKPWTDSVVYKVRVYDGTESVTGSIKIYRVECTGIGDNEALTGKVKVFPNPNTGVFTIDAEKAVHQIKIVNTQGVLIFSKVYNSRKASVNTHLAKGVYFVKIAIGNSNEIKGYVNRKIIVE